VDASCIPALHHRKKIMNTKTHDSATKKIATTNTTVPLCGPMSDDASITAQVKTALEEYRSTRSLTRRVETRNGEVTLTGLAKNAAEKSLISKRVADIQGVTCLKNQMIVDPVMTS